MRIYVTPRAGLKVRDPMQPTLGHLKPEGECKEDGQAWRRLEAAGDVGISEGPLASTSTSDEPAPRLKK